MTIQYETTVVRGNESAGRLIFALVTSKPAPELFTVQVRTRELNGTGDGLPVSDGFATGLMLTIMCSYVYYIHTQSMYIIT